MFCFESAHRTSVVSPFLLLNLDAEPAELVALLKCPNLSCAFLIQLFLNRLYRNLFH